MGVRLAAAQAGAAHGWAAVPVAARGPVSAALGRDDVRYWVRSTSTSLVARNPAQGLAVGFAPGGVQVRAGAGESLGLVFAGMGRDGRLAAAKPLMPLRSAANRVVYPRPGLREWWVNGPAGLEQGFTLAHRPAGQGELTLALSLSGSLAGRARAAGGDVWFGGLVYRGLAASDARGRLLPARLTLAGPRLLLRVDDRGAAYPLTVDPFLQQAKLTASDGAANDKLGSSIAVSGDTIAAGANQATVNGHALQGAVYVFVKPAGGWANATETAKLTASDGAAGDQLGQYSVAIDGDTIAAGAYLATVNGNLNQGAVYVFVKPAGGWADATETAKLTASDGAVGDQLGWTAAISGDTIAAGANQATVNGNLDQGAVYVFDKPGGGWANGTQTAKLTASDGATSDGLGDSVAIDGDTIAAAAGGASVNGHASQGAVYVFVKPGGGWANATQTAKLTASDGAANDQLGNYVRIGGDTIAASAPQASVNGNADQGAVYVFVKPGGGWANGTQTAKLTASDGAANDELGTDVGISGDTIAAGADDATVNGNAGQGAVYVFDKPGGGWANGTETAKLTASDGAASDGLGSSVAIDGSTIVAGAQQATVNGHSDQGAVYAFVNQSSGSGSGSGSSPPAASVPSPPVGLSVTVGIRQATVSFSSGGDDGKPISSYTLTAQPGNLTATGSSSPITLTGLADGGFYTFTVTATNTLGTSGASAGASARLPDTEPPTPTAAVSAGAAASFFLANGALKLGWQAATDNVGVAGYQIDRNGGPYKKLPPTQTSTRLRAFNPHAPTSFTVQAYDDANNQSVILAQVTVTPNPRPTTAPATIPLWAWQLARAQTHPHSTRPTTPNPLPAWYPAWQHWHNHTFTITP